MHFVFFAPLLTSLAKEKRDLKVQKAKDKRASKARRGRRGTLLPLSYGGRGPTKGDTK